MLNRVMIIGRLGQDPELRYSQAGAPFCNFSVATDESYTDRDGNRVERTEWHRITVFQRSAENCAKYLGKGSLVYVEGSIGTRKWQDQQGQDRYTTEIKAQRVVFLDRRGAATEEGYGNPNAHQGGYGGGGQGGGQAKPAATSQPREDLGPAFPSEASGMDEVPF